MIATWAVYLAVALWLLRALSAERGPRHDEALISAIAIVGRGMIVTLLAHYSMTAARSAPPAYLAVMCALTTLTIGQACTMARRGPVTRTVVPSEWVATTTRTGGDSEPARANVPGLGHVRGGEPWLAPAASSLQRSL